MKKILIIDYGYGNLFSLKKALIYAGAEVVVSSRPEDIKDAGALVLPGVGAFGDGIKELEKRGLKKAILESVEAGKPILGICLGMQFLFEKSNEFGEHVGLGLLKGEVKEIKVASKSFCKIPHIGWNKLMPQSKVVEFSTALLKGIKKKAQAYFVHSYAAYPKNSVDVIAETWYCESSFPSAVAKENIYGVQFHPEKSGETGIKILKNYISLI